MKTLLSLYWTGRLGLRELFFSADSDEDTMMERAAAMVAGGSLTTEQARTDLRADSHALDEHLAHLDNIRWVFDDPTYDDLVLQVAAFTEVYGDFPEVIVVDNLMNVIGDQENEWMAMRETTRALKALAHKTGALVMVLHHVSEDGKESDFPPARARIQGKVAQLPPMILGVCYVEHLGVLRVAPLKNRWAAADKSGRTFVEMPVNPATMQIFNSKYDQARGAAA